MIVTAMPIQFFARNSSAVVRSELNSAQMAATSARTQLISALNSESVKLPMRYSFIRNSLWVKKSGRSRGRIRAYGARNYFSLIFTVTSGELSAQVNSGALSMEICTGTVCSPTPRPFTSTNRRMSSSVSAEMKP